MRWKKIGNILVVDKKIDNPNQLLESHNVKTVVKIDNISGNNREPSIEILAGNETETIHKENYCLFKLDISKIMWSKGNTYERMRISNLINDDERVLDMFAGIGYFSIPIAVHSNPKIIHSIEINPNSYYYLNENRYLNKVENIINPILGDSNNLADNFQVDRILMGYIGNTHDYLGSAINSLDDQGIIHYHETVPDKIKFKRPLDRIKKVTKNRKITVLNKRIIKKYSPGIVHIVLDVKIT